MNVVGRAACAVLLSSLAFGTVDSRFKDVSVAIAEGYAPIACTSGVENPSVSCNHAYGK